MQCVCVTFLIDFVFSRLCWTHYVLRAPSNRSSQIYCCTIAWLNKILRKPHQWVSWESWQNLWVTSWCWTSVRFMIGRKNNWKRNVVILFWSLWLTGKSGILGMWKRISVWLSNTWSPNCRWSLLNRINTFLITIMKYALLELKPTKRSTSRKNWRMLSRRRKSHRKSKSDGLEQNWIKWSKMLALDFLRCVKVPVLRITRRNGLYSCSESGMLCLTRKCQKQFRVGRASLLLLRSKRKRMCSGSSDSQWR